MDFNMNIKEKNSPNEQNDSSIIEFSIDFLKVLKQ